ncbi:MAG: ABC transporter permease [Clostridia bacterium]
MSTFKKVFKKAFGLREFGVFMALIILVVVFSLTSQNFLTSKNLMNITRQVSVNALIAIGMTFVIITGGIDLSVGSVVAFSGIIASSAMVDFHLPVYVAVIIGILIGSMTGLVNGVLITYLNMPAFITTMGTMTILRGLGYIYTQGYPIYNLPKAFRQIGQGYLGTLPIPTIVLMVVALIAYVLLRRTVFGRHIYAIGGNAEAAKLMGIHVKSVNLMVYVICGTICGIAAVVQTSRLGSGLPTVGAGYELDAIASVVIGGAAMAGGSGTIIGTILGAVILGILSNGLSLLEVDSYVMQVISGMVVIIAVLIDELRKITSNRSQIKATRMAIKAESLKEK